MLIHVLFPIILFLIGIFGVMFSRLNILVTLMSLEVMLLSINLLAIFFSAYLDSVFGHLIALFLLCIGAAETAIGLALVVCHYKFASRDLH
jgi:NADH-quinone oxidoreductase subunit K